MLSHRHQEAPARSVLPKKSDRTILKVCVPGLLFFTPFFSQMEVEQVVGFFFYLATVSTRTVSPIANLGQGERVALATKRCATDQRDDDDGGKKESNPPTNGDHKANTVQDP